MTVLGVHLDRASLPAAQRRIYLLWPWIAGILAGGMIVLLVAAFCHNPKPRRPWISPLSTDQLQSQPARPEVLRVEPAPSA